MSESDDTTAAPPAPARRGDLAVIVREHRDYNVSTGVVEESMTCELGIVSSVTRSGWIKAYRPAVYWNTPGGGQAVPLAWLGARVTAMLVPASTIDVAAALKAATEPRWFSSPEEVREVLRPFLRTCAPAAAQVGAEAIA